MARRRPSKAEATRVLNRYRSAAGAGPYTGKDPHGALKRHGIDYYGPHDTGVHLPTLYKATAKSRKGRMAAKAVAKKKRNAVRRKRAKRVATGVGAAGLVLTSAAAGRSVAKNHRQIRSAGRSAASRTVNASRAASRSASSRMQRASSSATHRARRATTRRIPKVRRRF